MLAATSLFFDQIKDVEGKLKKSSNQKNHLTREVINAAQQIPRKINIESTREIVKVTTNKGTFQIPILDELA